jgi:hypothetical protein
MLFTGESESGVEAVAHAKLAETAIDLRRFIRGPIGIYHREIYTIKRGVEEESAKITARIYQC